MDHIVQIEDIPPEDLDEHMTDELKMLVGYGVNARRLFAMRGLRRVLLTYTPANITTAGNIMRNRLGARIDTLSGTYHFAGREHDAHTLNRCYKLLLKYEGTALSADIRRDHVIGLLGVFYTVDTWRQPDGPEREFMKILATHLVEGSLMPAA